MLPMARLREIGERLGLEGVSTYINSGNLLFTSTPEADLAQAITDEVQSEFGFSVPVVVCSQDRLRNALEHNPFTDGDPKLVFIYFCDREPTAERIADIDPSRSPEDHIAIRDREVYIWAPRGVQKSKFTLDYLQRTLGVPMTSRNVNTVRKLSGLDD